MAHFQLLIRRGTVIDGTGAPRLVADVAVQDARIAAVGDLSAATADQTIDASGLIVAPGFIDVHNHSDGWLLNTPHLTPKTLQGFTTELLMADGISYAPVNAHTAWQWLYYLRGLNGLRVDEYQGWYSLADYMTLLDGRNVQNSAAQLPYANLRTLACGWGRHPVDDHQARQIAYAVQQGMDEGAVGLSTGLDYVAQCFSTTTELVAACQAMASRGGVYVSHVRYKLGLIPALQEAIDIGRRAGVPVHISHLKAQPTVPADEVLTLIDRARRDWDVTFDVYPYQPGSTMLNFLFPYDIWTDGPLAAADKLDQPAIRDRLRVGLASYRLDLDHIRIAWLPSRDGQQWQGRTLAEYVRAMGLSAEAALVQLAIEERLAVLCVFDEGDDALVHPFLQHEAFMLGTDAIYFPGGHVHPRMYGSTGRILGPCVRRHKLFTLESAVARLTSRPAQRFGLRDRGVIRAGAHADLTIFNADTITDHATFADPCQPTTGVEHVIVNGRPIIARGQPLTIAGPLPGRWIRRESR